MTAKHCLGIVAICVSAAGCRVGHDVHQTVHAEPKQFHNYLEERVAKRRYREMARHAFTRSSGYGASCRSGEYVRGFEDGYVDLLFAGGNGEPPPIPPRRYWGRKYQTGSGRRAVQHWFDGFRDGAAAAKSSGYRELITVPSSTQVAANQVLCTEPIDSTMPMPTAPIDPHEALLVPEDQGGLEPEPIPVPDGRQDVGKG